jgi:hypothetical protein
MSFPIFGAPAPAVTGTSPPPSAPGGTGPPPVRSTEAPTTAIARTADGTRRVLSTISGSVGATYDFVGVTGYAIPYDLYNRVLGSTATRSSSPTESRGPFRPGRLSRTSSAVPPASPGPDGRTASPATFDAADAAAAAALRDTPP